MREYILYVILVFLPIGAIMAYMLQREGVSRRNTAIVVAISWLIIVSFPLSIAKLGTFIALLVYIAAILVMTRYLLGNKKEFVVESRGTLVTGNELEQLMVNLERQGYNISTDASGNYINISDEPAINSMAARPTAEAEPAGIPEAAALLAAEIDNIEIPIEDIVHQTTEDTVIIPDAASRLEAEAAEGLPADIGDKGLAEEEKAREALSPEPAAGAAPGQPDTAGDLLTDLTAEEPEMTTKDSETTDLQEDSDVPADIEMDDLESEIRDTSDFLETLQAVPEFEPWAEPEDAVPVTDEERYPEEVIEALPQETVDQANIELEKEAELEKEDIPVESVSQAVAGQPAAETFEVAGPDALEKESETWTESGDTGKTETTIAEIVQELEQEQAEKEIAEASAREIEEPAESLDSDSEQSFEKAGSEVEEPAEEMEIEDVQTMDETVAEAAPAAIAPPEVMPEAAPVPAEPDFDETLVEAAPLTESTLAEAEEPAATGLDLAETEIIDIPAGDSTQSCEEAGSESEIELAAPAAPESQDTVIEADFAAEEPEAAAALDAGDAEPAESLDSDSEQSFEKADSEVEEPAELIKIEDVQAIDEAVVETRQEAEALAEVMPEAASIPAEPDLDETPAEAAPLTESTLAEAEEPAATGLDWAETEIIDILAGDSTQSCEEADREPEIELAAPESQDAIVEEESAAEPELYEITGESDIEIEIPKPAPETGEAVALEYYAEPQESPALLENLADRAEPTELELAEDSSDTMQGAVDSELLTEHPVKEPDPLLFELIDRGFALKEMGNLQEAGQCFMDADALTEDLELKELLNMEIVAIFRLLS